MWTFEHTGFRPGAYNMHYDEFLAREVAEGRKPPTVRLFGWSPPAISLGWNQPEEDINVEAAARAGVDVVRRPTGGRAILHSDELTYSVVMPADGRNIATVYREISRALVCGLEKLGVHASLEDSQPHFPSFYRSVVGAACFSISARSEIKVNGKKIVGSAQRRFCFLGEEVILQHGSLLLGSDHRRIVHFLTLRSEDERRLLAEELERKTTDLQALLGYRPRFEEVAEAIRQGFEEAWGITFESSPPPFHQQAIPS
jgi:lipoate-protein ligase A